MDFLGLNLYTATMASARTSNEPLPPEFNNDIQADISPDPNWIPTARDSFKVSDPRRKTPEKRCVPATNAYLYGNDSAVGNFFVLVSAEGLQRSRNQ